MAGVLLSMTGKYSKWQGALKAKEILESGKALAKMNEIIRMQGKQKRPSLGEYRYLLKSGKAGIIKEIDNEIIAKIARVAGAPRDKGSGLFLNKKVHQKVKRGEPLYTIYAESKFKLDLSLEIMRKNNGYLIK